MSIMNIISGTEFKEMVQSAAHWLQTKHEDVDRLNVFPVPDGDTGTNMAMTMKSSAKFMTDRSQDDSVGELAKQMAYGALMGARGNSGVILSQILAGFAKAVEGKDAIDTEMLIQAFSAGADAAYRAVSNPMEGTVLTVVREASEALRQKSGAGLTPMEAMDLFLSAGYQSLARTPDLLPVLKQAGVVDAGGQGFLCVIEGMLASLKGEPVEALDVQETPMENLNDAFDHFFTDPESIVYPYCTEFLIHAKRQELESSIQKIKGHFETLGDCMLVVGTGETIKVHIHTDRLGQVLGFASEFGELNDIKINNMRQQNRELQAQKQLEEPSKYAIITVANGLGLVDIFKSMGATHIIHGGQTMNPSTQEFLDILSEVNAEYVLILPNNKNIIMAAQQAADLADHMNVAVIPSKTIPQGLQALMAFIPDMSLDENIEAMTEGLTEVASGEITHAVRDTEIDGVAIQSGQCMAILDGKIIASVDTQEECLDQLIQRMIDQGAGLITLYAGDDLTESMVEDAVNNLEERYSDVDFEWYMGGQQIYPYLISAE